MKHLKSFIILAVCIVIFGMFTSCTTAEIGQVGVLPRKWWEKDRGEIENHMRENGTGYYANVLAFIGSSDSKANFSAQMALDDAKLEAMSRVSEHIISKVIYAMESNRETIYKQALEETNLSEVDEEIISRSVGEVINSFRSMLSITQFSSFIIEASHVEQVKGPITYFKAWVVGTIQDSIVEELKEIQKEAFNSMVNTTEQYNQVMNEIQSSMAKKMEESFLTEFDIKSND